jgi:two-component system, NarL family, response regulator LiaR
MIDPRKGKPVARRGRKARGLITEAAQLPKGRDVLRVVLVDDHDVFRSMLRGVLDHHDAIEVVGEARNGHEALHVVERTRPDVVLMDVRMPVLNGIEATSAIKARFPDIGVLALSTTGEMAAVVGMAKSGASGYVLKGGTPDDLIAAIKDAAAGKRMRPKPDQFS